MTPKQIKKAAQQLCILRGINPSGATHAQGVGITTHAIEAEKEIIAFSQIARACDAVIQEDEAKFLDSITLDD